MTPDERSILQQFLSDLAAAPRAARDPEASAMIQNAIGANPDALYLLVQHAILSDQALHSAQAQIAAQQPPTQSFLPTQPAYDPGYQPGQAYAPQSYAPQANAPQMNAPWAGMGGAPVQSSPLAANGGLGSFLRSAGTMAAGVAAGDFLFQGIENIFSPRW